MNIKNKSFTELRYFKDDPSIYGFNDENSSDLPLAESVQLDLLSRGIAITEAIFPDLAAIINDIKQDICPEANIESYICNDSQAQASCIAVSGDVDAIILLTSGLITLLTLDELKFVIGHEIGHYLFKHYLHPRPSGNPSDNTLANSMNLHRAAEISADRIGMISSNQIDHAARAIIKTVSGLPEQYIRFDISSYLDQLREIESIGGDRSGFCSTHPMFPVRLKALLWFQMSEPYYYWFERPENAPLRREKLDNKIHKDIESSIGNESSRVINKAINTAKIWSMLLLASLDNRLSKDDQDIIKSEVQNDDVDKAIDFMRINGPESVSEKMTNACKALSSNELSQRKQFFSELLLFTDKIDKDTESEKLINAKINEIKKLICL